MKVELDEFKAKKNGIVTPKALITELLDHLIIHEDIEVVIYVTRNKEGEVEIGYSQCRQSEIIGLLEISKSLTIDDILDQ